MEGLDTDHRTHQRHNTPSNQNQHSPVCSWAGSRPAASGCRGSWTCLWSGLLQGSPCPQRMQTLQTHRTVTATDTQNGDGYRGYNRDNTALCSKQQPCVRTWQHLHSVCILFYLYSHTQHFAYCYDEILHQVEPNIATLLPSTKTRRIPWDMVRCSVS